MDQFRNPSAVAPFRGGYLLLVGEAGSPYNQLKFQYCLLPAPGENPAGFNDFDFTDDTNPTSKPSPFITNGGPLTGSLPFLFALDDQTLQVVYYGKENGVNGVFGHTFFDDGTTLHRIQTAQLLVSQPDTTPLALGAATIPGMAGVLLATFPINYDASISTVLTWCAVPEAPTEQLYGLNVQDLYKGFPAYYQNQCSLAVVPNNKNGTDPFLGILMNSCGGPVPAFSNLMTFSIGMSSGTPTTITDFRANNPGAGGSIPIVGAGMYRGGDGCAYVQWVDPNAGLWIAPMSYITEYPYVQFMDAVLVANSRGATQLKPVFYTFGTWDTNPAVGDVQIVNTYRTIAWDSSHFQSDQVGQAQRTVFSQPTDINTAKGVVVGIFDSCPPTPNENVANLADDVQVGITTFGNTETNTTGWTMSGSIGGFFEINVGAGVTGIASCDRTMKVSLGVTSAGSAQVQETDVKVFQSPASTITTNGVTVVSPQGGAMVIFTDYIGYKFEFLDTNGDPLPAASAYYELYPTGPPVVNTPPFDIDPSATSGVIPGNLPSYEVTADVTTALQSQLLDPNSFAQFAWGSGPTGSNTNGYMTTSSRSVGCYFEFDSSITVSAGDELSHLTVGAGVSLKYNFNYSWVTSDSDVVSTAISLLAASAQNPDAYSYYTYNAYLLEHDVAHTQDLIAQLSSYSTKNNQDLLNMMQPNSAPWKIVHVLLTASSQGQDLEARAREFLSKHPGWKPRSFAERNLKPPRNK
jgi:hypothetical protein